jgi:hypothetical protein
MNSKVFLETSVIRKLEVGHTKVQCLIEEERRGKESISSYFVFMEYKRGLIFNLIKFYFRLKEENTVEDAMNWWLETYKIRELKDVTPAIFHIVKGSSSELDKISAITRLKAYILTCFYGFRRHIDRFSDNLTRCHIGKKVNLPINRMPEDEDFIELGELLEKDHSHKCKIKNFLRQKTGMIEKLVKAKNPKDCVFKQIEHLERQQKEQSASCKFCERTGDSIIALECSNKVKLFTFDEAFVTLCGILGIELKLFQSTRKITRQSTA